MSEPRFKFTKAELADVYRELVAIHKRDGCEIGLAGNVDLRYEMIAPGAQMALVASVCRDITRVGNGFVQGHFQQEMADRREDLTASWLVHWAATQNRTRPTVWQRVQLLWWRYKDRVGLSAPLPPDQ